MALIGSIGISAGCEAPIPVDTADPLWAIPAQYSFALSFSGGVAAAQKSDSQWVFLDKTGEDVFDESFVQVDYQFSQYPGFMNGLAIVTPRGELEPCLLYRNGQTAGTAPKFDLMYSSDGPLFLARTEDEKYGYLNLQMAWYQLPIYDFAKNFEYGWSVAQQEGEARSALISPNGMQANIEGDVYVVSEGLALVDGSYYTDLEGNVVLPGPYEEAGPFCEGLAPIRVDGYYGYIDKFGEIAIEPQFAEADLFSEGMARVTDQEGRIAFIDRNGEIVIPFQAGRSGTQMHGGVVPFSTSRLGGFGLLSKDGSWALSPHASYHDIMWEEDGCYVLYSGNMRGLYFPETKVWIKAKYEDITLITKQRAIVEKDDKYGLLDLATGEEIVAPTFSWIAYYGEGLVAAKQFPWSQFGYLNMDGAWVIEPQFDVAYGFHEGLACVSKGGKYGFIANPLIYSAWSADEVSRAQQLLKISTGSPDTAATVGDLKMYLEQVSAALDDLSFAAHFDLSEIVFPEETVPLSRGLAAALICDAATNCGKETGCMLAFFEDVSPGSEYEAAIAYAAGQGYFELEQSGYFYPKRICSATDTVKLAQRFFEIMLDPRRGNELYTEYLYGTDLISGEPFEP